MKSVKQVEAGYISETWFKFQSRERKSRLHVDFSK